jgi:hypothetical protein
LYDGKIKQMPTRFRRAGLDGKVNGIHYQPGNSYRAYIVQRFRATYKKKMAGSGDPGGRGGSGHSTAPGGGEDRSGTDRSGQSENRKTDQPPVM